jgi:cytochrome P450
MPRCPGFDPPPEFADLRGRCPRAPVRTRHDQVVSLLTRYADVRATLRDHERFSSDPSRPGYPQLRPVVDTAAAPGSFLVIDPPAHTRFRKALTGEFTARRMRELTPRIERVTDTRLTEMLGRGTRADLVADFALPVPSDVICLLLGVPTEDQRFFATRSRAHLDRALNADQVASALAELNAYLEKLVTTRHDDPGDDLISRLVSRGTFTSEEIVGMTVLLLVGGHETTANSIALSVLALHRFPDQWQALRENPSLLDGAVEELLRYLSPVHQGVVRAVTTTTDLGDGRLPAGTGVIASLFAANRDPDEFPTPDTLDVRRDAARHLAFGSGVHQCVGQLLARIEMTVALRALLTRVPTLRIAVSFEEVEFRFDTPIYGLAELPVTW